jgi:8-oxo-dGTP pyrophosphatase MutT (NUDIX family)
MGPLFCRKLNKMASKEFIIPFRCLYFIIAKNGFMDNNPWKTLGGELKYENKWISVTEFEVINPSGKPGIYGKVHFKNKAIGIVPLDDSGNIWLVGQWRYPLNQWSWEIPEGGGPLGNDLLESAQRELREETGLVASNWKMIQRLHLSNSVSDEEGFLFLATGITESIIDREETEADMKVWRLPFRDAYAMVLNSAITDSLTVTALLRVATLYPSLL